MGGGRGEGMCARDLSWASDVQREIIIIIIKRISRAPIYHTRWQHRALSNNTNHTHTHTHTHTQRVSDEGGL